MALTGLTMWGVWAVNLSVPGNMDRLGKVKGTDFLHFYVIGSLVREHAWNALYDVRIQSARTQALAPESTETLYLPIESPQMAIGFAPFARFEYTDALMLWVLTTILLYAASCLVVWNEAPALGAYRNTALWTAAACPAFYSAVLFGQTSCMSLACVVAAIVLLRRGHGLGAGFALGSLVFKPHWAAAAGLVFAVAREWRVVTGIVVGAAGQLAVTLAAVGFAVMSAYLRALATLPATAELLEPRPSDSLKGFFGVLVPHQPTAMILYAAAAAAVLVMAAAVWRSRARFELRCSAALMALVLINPHVGAYDLVLLTPVYFFLAAGHAWSFDDRRDAGLATLLALSFVAPMITHVPPIVRLMASVAALAGSLVLVWRIQAERSSVSMISSSLASSAANPHCSGSKKPHSS
jgi:hypothetical protein